MSDAPPPGPVPPAAPVQPGPPPEPRRGPPTVGPPGDRRGYGGPPGGQGNDRGDRRGPPRSEKPRNDGSKPAMLDRTDFAALRPDKKSLDADLEAEMNAKRLKGSM